MYSMLPLPKAILAQAQRMREKKVSAPLREKKIRYACVLDSQSEEHLHA